MEVHQSTNLLDLPTEILEKIVDYLPFVTVRKNLRLTCKILYNFLNLEYFCRDEVIIWPADCEEKQRLISAAFTNSTRGCYNLIFKSVDLEFREVTVFFQQNGANIRSLHFENCKFPSGLLESIIICCEGLVSLIIGGCCLIRNSLFEPIFVIRPSVTFLTLKLNESILQQSPNIFHRILFTFPCVRHLDIGFDNVWEGCQKSNVPVPVISDFVKNFGHLQSLNLEILFDDESLEEKLQFPKLKELHLKINGRYEDSYGSCEVLLHSWHTFTSRLNGVSSISIWDIPDIDYPWDIFAPLSGTDLENLTLVTDGKIYLSLEAFKSLVSSNLKKIEFRVDSIISWTHMTEDLSIEANKTVSDLRINTREDGFTLMVLFSVSFHGVIHLELNIVNDTILQSIFKFQQNLRSLVLIYCMECSIAGFCGSEDDAFKSSITNLQKLELLDLYYIDEEVIQSECFQTAVSLPKLKYLKLEPELNSSNEPKFQIPVNMLKSNSNLEAVCLEGFIEPSSEVLSSLFQKLKYLNYLSVSYSYDRPSKYCSRYINLKHFYWIDWVKLLSQCSSEVVSHDQILDRTVFQGEKGKSVRIYSPRIGSYTVDWINLFLNQ